MSLIGTFGFGDSGVVVVYDQNTKLKIIQKKFKVNINKIKFSSEKITLKFKTNTKQLKFKQTTVSLSFKIKVIKLKFKKGV